MAYLKSVLCTLLLFKKPDVLRSHHHLQISAILSHLDGGIYNSKNKEICTLCNMSSSPTYKFKVGKVTSEKS